MFAHFWQRVGFGALVFLALGSLRWIIGVVRDPLASPSVKRFAWTLIALLIIAFVALILVPSLN
jgi:hypothetical protein